VHFMTSATDLSRPNGRRLRPVRQGLALNEVLASVRSRVATSPLPVDASVDVDPLRGRRILSLLDRIGGHFQSRILGPLFDPDPQLTFVVDAGVTDEDRSLVSDAVSHGAVIHIPRREASSPMRTPRGERFRLSYLVAAQYQLPPILGRPVNLSTILKPPQSGPPLKQDPLPPDMELRLFHDV
jgi:hypothetical protein